MDGTMVSITESEFWTTLPQDISSTPGILNETGNQTTQYSGVSRFYPVIVTEMVISVICLVFSIVVYSILPEFKNVHGKNLISLSACLLTSYLLLTFDILFRKHVSATFCFTVAAMVHVTFLATFFWTNVMAFDIYRTISDLKPTKDKHSHSQKYLKYSIYAWSATILTALPAAILESTDLVPADYRPKFGVRRCWLSGMTSFIFYFNLPVGIILFSNLVMFLLTIRKLWLIKKMTVILQVKQQQKRLNLYLKLFLVMGITWVSEFLPWVTGIYALYALAGMLTALHGLMLFLIFVAKKKTFLQVRDHFRDDNKRIKKISCSQPTLSTTANTSIKFSDIQPPT